MTRPVHEARFVSASELGEYAYCRRAWWLRAVEGVTSAKEGKRFKRGRAMHRRHALILLLARAFAVIAALLLLAAVWISISHPR